MYALIHSSLHRMQGYLRKELKTVGALVAATPATSLTLHFERVLLTDTGTLLMTWTNPSGEVARLRNRLAHTFPGMRPL